MSKIVLRHGVVTGDVRIADFEALHLVGLIAGPPEPRTCVGRDRGGCVRSWWPLGDGTAARSPKQPLRVL